MGVTVVRVVELALCELLPTHAQRYARDVHGVAEGYDAALPLRAPAMSCT